MMHRLETAWDNTTTAPFTGAERSGMKFVNEDNITFICAEIDGAKFADVWFDVDDQKYVWRVVSPDIRVEIRGTISDVRGYMFRSGHLEIARELRTIWERTECHEYIEWLDHDLFDGFYDDDEIIGV